MLKELRGFPEPKETSITTVWDDIHKGPVEYIVGYIVGLARRVNIRCLNEVLYDRYFRIHVDIARTSQGYYAR